MHVLNIPQACLPVIILFWLQMMIKHRLFCQSRFCFVPDISPAYSQLKNTVFTASSACDCMLFINPPLLPFLPFLPFAFAHQYPFLSSDGYRGFPPKQPINPHVSPASTLPAAPPASTAALLTTAPLPSDLPESPAFIYTPSKHHQNLQIMQQDRSSDEDEKMQDNGDNTSEEENNSR